VKWAEWKIDETGPRRQLLRKTKVSRLTTCHETWLRKVRTGQSPCFALSALDPDRGWYEGLDSVKTTLERLKQSSFMVAEASVNRDTLLNRDSTRHSRYILERLSPSKGPAIAALSSEE